MLNNQNEEIILYESATIMRFICQKFNLPQNWYSHKEENLVRRSLIDQYLDWHHGNTRRILATSVRNEFFFKKESTRKEFDRLFQYLESELGKHLYIISLNLLNILPKLFVRYLKYIAFKERFLMCFNYLKPP